MNLTKPALRQLLRLQEHDKVLDSLEAELDRIPGEIQILRDGLEAEKSKLTEAKNKATRLQITRKEKENELSLKEDAVKKHNLELNQIKTNEAYKALQAEIDRAKAQAGDLETAILILMDEIDQAAREEKSCAAALIEAQAKTQQAVQERESRGRELAESVARRKTERETLAAGISADVLKLYDYLHRRKQGIALSAVHNGLCSLCRITILPQSLVELARGVELIACESCQRILYEPLAVAAETARPS